MTTTNAGAPADELAHVTPAKPIDKDRFMQLLELLPPCRWYRGAGVEWFHISEHLTGRVVLWAARVGAQYWEFADLCTLSDGEIALKLDEAVRAARG